ncbi:MAG TPA: tRNA pseudouridine(38-40) synthase TruA [Egibacteraceae bacterium]|nr:tRNA pseudouridine(38-40) synthase TruA [Egibacteraceae bacterium]
MPEAATLRIRIDLAYDGSGFHGFARQSGQRTVQGVVEAALERLCGQAVPTTAAGRTDAGVHAAAQVVHCDVPASARLASDLAGARSALDALCGPEVTVWRVRRVPAHFDARFSARQRRYRYRLCDADAMSPLWRHDTWHLGGPVLDVDAMGRGGAHLVGEHDFSSFCRRRGDQQLVRRIDRVAVRRAPGGLVTIRVDGKAFCHQMVRSVTGCLVAVGRGRRRPEWVADVLAARDRQAVGHVAPPHGLTLIGVSFGPAGGPAGTRSPRGR